MDRFLSWLEVNHPTDIVHMDETLSIINELSKDVSQASFADVIQNTSCGTILALFDTYLIHLRCDNGNLLMFWMSYLGMI